MAEFLTKKVSELVEAPEVTVNDLVPISQADGVGGYISKHVKLGTMANRSDLAENPATTTGLTWGWLAGQVRSDNVITDVAAGTLTLTDNATNYVEYTMALGVTVNQVGFTSGAIPIRTVVTLAGVQTSSVDGRAWLNDLADYYNKANVLGTVSQTVGVPTGALMEYGSNANGEYWKYAGGMMVCNSILITTTLNTTWGGLMRSSGTGNTNWTFPSVFISAPRVTSADSPAVPLSFIIPYISTTTGVTAVGVSADISGTNVSAHLVAIGRWYE